MHDSVALTMAAWQPNLGAREGLEPLGSDLEGCYMAQMVGYLPLDSFD